MQSIVSAVMSLKDGPDTPDLPVIAAFQVRRRGYLSADGEMPGRPPGFAANAEVLIALYRGMVLLRSVDAKAVVLQRTGRLGTYGVALGQEAVSVGMASAMRSDDDGGRFAAADAQSGNPAAAAGCPQRAEQRDDDARARRADGMAQSAGAAVDVQFVVGDSKIGSCRHGDDREGLVDLEQIDVRSGPTGLFLQLANGVDGRSREPGGLLGVGGVADEPGKDRRAERLGRRLPHDDEGCRAVVDRT